MNIRPYESRDRDDVRFVCLNCDGPSDMSPQAEHFILSTYCDYYIEKEPHNCFVAENEEGRAIGYIICTENFDSFYDIFKKEYIPRIPEEETDHRFYASTSAVLQEKYKDSYPAHFHIDILPEYHRMGIGHKLVDTLIKHLKEKNIPAVMLAVSRENLKGDAFYRKYGFELIESTPSANVYGIKFKK